VFFGAAIGSLHDAPLGTPPYSLWYRTTACLRARLVCRECGLLATAAPSACFFAVGRGVGVAAAGRNPAVVRRAVLEELRVLAERVALGVYRVGLSEDLAGPQGLVVDAGDHGLVAVIGLGVAGEGAEVVVADDDDVDARDAGDLVDVGDA